MGALERHGRMLRFRLPARCPLADVFEQLENARTSLYIEEYGINQTSLEQIFNNFAARQQEETNAVQGLFMQEQGTFERALSFPEPTPTAGDESVHVKVSGD